VFIEANKTQEVSHEGTEIILRFKDNIKADRCPLGGGGVIEVAGADLFRDSQEGVERD